MALKVFISQPMGNRTEQEIESERERMMRLAEKALGDKCKEIPSYNPNFKGEPPLKALGRSIQLMAQADVVVFAPGWKYARGCKVEHMCAESYGLEICEVEEGHDED